MSWQFMSGKNCNNATRKRKHVTQQKSAHVGQKSQCQECKYQATVKGNLDKHQQSIIWAVNSDVQSVNIRLLIKVILLAIRNQCIWAQYSNVQTFNISQVRSVAFQLQISPFSANISLKKTLIKDKSGTPVLPTTSSGHSCDSLEEIATPVKKNLQLERELWSLRLDHENAVEDCNAANLKIKSLESLPAVKLEC